MKAFRGQLLTAQMRCALAAAQIYELQLGDFFVFLSITLHTRRLMFVTHTYSKKLGILRAFPTLKGLQNSAPVLLTNRTYPRMSLSLIARVR
jgi:hypothetical protein